MQPYLYDVCIVGGAGHIGLPFGLVFAHRGLNVAIYDVNQESLRTIGQGVVPFMEQGADSLLQEALERGNLTLTNQPEIVSQARTVVITIGTPVDEFLNPEFRYIKDCLETLLPCLRDGQLLILRSTVFPGTTDWLVKWLEGRGKHLNVSFCPERVVQGKAIEEILDLPQIIGPTSPAAERESIALFNHLEVEIVKLEPMEAEFAKLFSNAYRYITFAIANQFYMLTTTAGVDYENVMQGVKFHYPRLQGLAGAGFAAGPCLFKDTMQLNAYAKNEFFLGQAAMNVNEGLVLYIVDRLCNKYNLPETTVGLLGMAFKPDNDDIRSSLSYKMKKVMQFKAKEVLMTDPYVKVDRDIIALEEVIEKSDVLILCVPHSQYRNLDTRNKPVVDIWGFLGQGTLF